MRKIFTTILVLTAVLFVACRGDDASPTPTPTEVPDPNSLADPQDALDAARALWATSGDDYDLTFNWQCFCIVDYVQRVDLQVRNGTVEAGAVTDTGAPLAPDLLAEYLTVEQLFDFIQGAIDENAEEIRATYAADGYPTEVWVDFNRRMADEERGFFIHALTPA